MRKDLVMAAVLVTGVVAGGLLTAVEFVPRARAQSKSSRKSNVKVLDVRAQKLQADFTRSSTDLARDYEAAGELEKARQVYMALSRLNPQAKDIQAKLKQVSEAILSANSFDVEIDTAAGWGAPLARVSQGKAIHVQAGGTYRFQANLPVGPEGFPVGESAKADMAENVRCGALMGLVVRNGKPGKPFPVGADREIKPPSDGLLYLRVNVPPGSRCTGTLTVRLSGYVERN